jgi:hypothetical protein
MTTQTEEQKSWVETVDNIAALEARKGGDTVGFEEGTDEEKKLVRKIDLFLMPTIWVLYCFSYMDRTNIVSKHHLQSCLPSGRRKLYFFFTMTYTKYTTSHLAHTNLVCILG